MHLTTEQHMIIPLSPTFDLWCVFLPFLYVLVSWSVLSDAVLFCLVFLLWFLCRYLRQCLSVCVCVCVCFRCLCLKIDFFLDLTKSG